MFLMDFRKKKILSDMVNIRKDLDKLLNSKYKMIELLKNEKIQYEMKIGIYDKADNPEKTFVERAQTIISKETTIWSSTVKKK